MSFPFAQNLAYTMVARLDIPSYATLQRDGFTVAQAQSLLRERARMRGWNVDVPYIRSQRNVVTSDVVSMRVNFTSPNAATNSDIVSQFLLETMNAAAGVGYVNRFSPNLAHGVSSLFGGSAMVVDESTIRQGTSNEAPLTSESIIARSAAAATGSQIVDSTNPADVGSGPPLVNPDGGIPWYITTGLVVGGIILAGVLVGYTFRSFK